MNEVWSFILTTMVIIFNLKKITKLQEKEKKLFMQQLCLTIKTFDKIYLKNTVNKILEFLNFLVIFNVKFSYFPVKKKKITVLKSPHIDKKSRDQFEFRTFKLLLIINSKISKTNKIMAVREKNHTQQMGKTVLKNKFKILLYF